MSKKAFTLIELLAVIVILAIILVIAVPKILGVIQNARKGIVDDDARLIIDTINRKRNIDPDFKPEEIDETNVMDRLGIKSDNYDSLDVSYQDDDIYVEITGKNKYDGLVACGTSKDMLVVSSGDTSGCASSEPTGPLIYHVMETTYQYQTATTALTMDDDDDGAGSIDFNLTFGDTTYTTLYVSTNGYITFNQDDAYEYNNNAFVPDINYPIIAGYWTDLRLSTNVTLDYGIYYSKGTDNGENYLLVEYRNICDLWANDCDDESTGNFEMKLYEDGEIYVYYQDMNFGASDYNNGGNGTTGVYVSETNYSRYSYNEPIIDDGLALKYYLAPGTIEVGPCFEFSEGTITGYSFECSRDVVIPSTIDGIDVTTIGEKAFWDEGITSVELPDSVTTLEYGAFQWNELTNVDIPDSVITIGKQAFYDNQISSVTIPNGVTTIGQDAFSWNELTNVDIPDSVTTIGMQAFYRNQLTSVTIPTGVTALEYGVFEENQLTSVTIGTNVISIGDYAFGDNLLASITIPSSVTTIGISAFGSNRLTSVTIPNGVTTLGGFESNQITSITIPASVTTIDYRAFYNNQIVNLTIPNTVTAINAQAFSRNYLNNLTLGTNVATIGDFAFAFNSISSLTIPNSVTTIGEAAFSPNSLTSLTLGTGLTTIGKGAFNDNRLPDNQAFIYKRNANGTEDTSVVVGYGGLNRSNVIIPNNVTTIGTNAFVNNKLTSVTIPSTVITIDTFAFTYNELTSVTIPASVTTIGMFAFGNNKLTSVTISSGVTSMGNGAFWKEMYSNSNLTSVINQTGRSFDWGNVINAATGYNFVTGTVVNGTGNVTVSAS